MLNKHSKIYIAGHKGLVGSAICRKLKFNGFRIKAFYKYIQLKIYGEFFGK